METIKIKANQSKRTFTIRKVYKDGSTVKYRTLPMNQEEFNGEEYNTQNDWNYFLRNTNDYYKV